MYFYFLYWEDHLSIHGDQVILDFFLQTPAFASGYGKYPSYLLFKFNDLFNIPKRSQRIARSGYLLFVDLLHVRLAD